MGRSRITNLRRMLSKKQMSQKELSEATGIPEYKISLLARGKVKHFRMTTVKRICTAIGCSVDEAFGDIMV